MYISSISELRPLRLRNAGLAAKFRRMSAGCLLHCNKARGYFFDRAHGSHISAQFTACDNSHCVKA